MTNHPSLQGAEGFPGCGIFSAYIHQILGKLGWVYGPNLGFLGEVSVRGRVSGEDRWTQSLGPLTQLQSEEQRFLYILHFEVVDEISPVRHLKNLAFKECGSKGVSKGQEQGGCRGQRGSKVPYFLHQEIIVTLLTWNMGFGYSHSRGSGGYLVCSIKGKGLFWEQDNICHNSLHFSLYFPHSFPHWSWNPKC